jgi:hypothetical protein
MQARTLARKRDSVRRSTRELYGFLAELGERLYLEAMCLCDDEQEAAAWASAILVRSLEERKLLERVSRTT